MHKQLLSTSTHLWYVNHWWRLHIKLLLCSNKSNNCYSLLTMLLNSVLLNLFSVTVALLPECKQEFRKLAYYKVKSCHKSPLSGLFQRNVDSLKGCKVLARERGGLAFNFSPPEVNQSPNCLILSCPETGNFSTLVPHPSYDYYSAYASQNRK